MAEFIYCRISGDNGQQHDSQTVALLKKYPLAHLTTEVASGAKARPMLHALLSQLRAGDVLVVAALDRLGRRVVDLLTILEDLQKRGIIFRSEREHIDFSTPIGKMVTAILASTAELERSIISDRTRQGISAARAKGKQIGRPRTISDRTLSRGVSLVQSHGYTIARAAKEIGVSYGYLSQVLRGQRMNATESNHKQEPSL